MVSNRIWLWFWTWLQTDTLFIWRTFLIVFFFLSNTVKWCSCFSCTQPGPQHVHFNFHTGFHIVCAALQPRGTPCVLTVQTHSGLPQASRHSGFYSYSITAPTATTNVNLLCGIHRTQWGNKYRNTTSTQYFLIPSPSSLLSPPPDTGVHFIFAGGQ